MTTYAGSDSRSANQERICRNRQTYLSTGTSKNPCICDACRSIVLCVCHESGVQSSVITKVSSQHTRPRRHTHNEMITSRLLQHICNKFCRDRCTTLVFFVLTCIWKQWDDGGDTLRAGNLASVDHNAKFHQGRIHSPTSRVDDIHIIFSHRFGDANVRLPDATLCYFCTCDLYTESRYRQLPRKGSIYEISFDTVCRWSLPTGGDSCLAIVLNSWTSFSTMVVTHL